MNPLIQFNKDRAAARTADDPTAAVCYVANIDEMGLPRVRTLVLRDVDGQLALFINASSPKWQALLQHKFAVTTYWPSQQLQYRLIASSQLLAHDVVAQSWQFRPDAPKRMDWFYQQNNAQSSVIADREQLIQGIENQKLPDPLIAPDGANGMILLLHEIERLDLAQPNGIHERTLFTHDKPSGTTTNDVDWRAQTLVP